MLANFQTRNGAIRTKRVAAIALICISSLLYTGLPKPAIADTNLPVVLKEIDKKIKDQPGPKWDEVIAPQLVKRDEQEAERKRQAEEAARQAAAVQQIADVPAPQVQPVGNCALWMQQAGVTDMANASWLIARESGCRTSAVNPSSGACGIPQALPCSKLGAARGNPVAEIQWMQNYVNARYGGWAGAVAFWRANNWY